MPPPRAAPFPPPVEVAYDDKEDWESVGGLEAEKAVVEEEEEEEAAPAPVTGTASPTLPKAFCMALDTASEVALCTAAATPPPPSSPPGPGLPAARVVSLSLENPLRPALSLASWARISLLRASEI